MRRLKRRIGRSVLPFERCENRPFCYWFSFPATLWALFQRPSSSDQVQKQWLHVLELKRNWSEAAQRKDPSALSRKQMWADALAQFTAAYPDHERAAKAHEDVTIDYAVSFTTRAGMPRPRISIERCSRATPGVLMPAAALELALTRMSISRSAFDKMKKGNDRWMKCVR